MATVLSRVLARTQALATPAGTTFAATWRSSDVRSHSEGRSRRLLHTSTSCSHTHTCGSGCGHGAPPAAGGRATSSKGRRFPPPTVRAGPIGTVHASAQVLVPSDPPSFTSRIVDLNVDTGLSVPPPPSCKTNPTYAVEDDDDETSRGVATLGMIAAAICASDIHTVDGRRPAVPSHPHADCTMGHEGG
jgi:hypothetical protein